MKAIIIQSLKDLVADRYLLILLSSLTILTFICVISLGLSIQPSERQLISHYSAFGITHFYFDQWFYQFVFVIFGLIVSILHSVVAVKLLIVKGHSLAIMYAWFGIAVVLIGWVTFSEVLGLRMLL